MSESGALMADPNTNTLASVARIVARSLYLLIAAALASFIAAVIGLHVAFGPEWLQDFEDSGFALLLIIFQYVLVGLPGLLLIYGLLRKSAAPRWRDFLAYTLLSAAIGLLWFAATQADTSMTAYGAVSGAAAGILFWPLTRLVRSA